MSSDHPLSYVRFITVTHVNKKTPIKVRVGLITGLEHDKVTQSTLIHVPGGIYPVQETIEQIETLINKETKSEPKQPTV